MAAAALELSALLFVAGLLGCISGCVARRLVTDWKARRASQGNSGGPSRLITSRQPGAPSSFMPDAPEFLLMRKDEIPDNLQNIRGVGAKIEKSLNYIGVFYFQQIGDWSRGNLRWIEQKLKIRGRIDREGWVPQARQLAAEQMRARAIAQLPDEASAGTATVAETAKPEIAPDADSGSSAGILAAPREGGADDLKKISGIGPRLEEKLNQQGVYHYDQIASWTEAQIDHFDGILKFKGRIVRENWCDQAEQLAREASQTAGDAHSGGGSGATGPENEPDSEQ